MNPDAGLSIHNRTVRLDQLLLDPNNYRLRHLFTGESRTYERIPDEGIADRQQMIQGHLASESLGKLISSIRRSGFLQVDQLVVRPLAGAENTWVVVEGNRRTAALRALMKEHTDGSRPDPRLAAQAQALHVVCLEGPREKIDSYAAVLMGMRHVSGIHPWKGVNNAMLVFDLVEGGTSLEEVEEFLGLDPGEARRRYDGYRAFLQMRDDPVYGSRSKPSSHYTLLTEFTLRKHKVGEWLAWNSGDGKFDDDTNRAFLYQLLAPESGEPQIRNQGDARKVKRFITDKSLIGDSTRMQLLQSGVPLGDIPDVEKAGWPPLRRLKNAYSHIQAAAQGELDTPEHNLLARIQKLTLSLLKNSGDDGE